MILAGQAQHHTHVSKSKMYKKSAVLGKKISYTLAKNYFVKNDVGNIPPTIIDNSVSFESVFGMATTMGEAGKPTHIDFSKQFVVPIVLPESTIMQTISIVSVTFQHGNLAIRYQVKKGAKLSYTMRPSQIIIIDQAYKGNLVVTKI